MRTRCCNDDNEFDGAAGGSSSAAAKTGEAQLNMARELATTAFNTFVHRTTSTHLAMISPNVLYMQWSSRPTCPPLKTYLPIAGQ